VIRKAASPRWIFLVIILSALASGCSEHKSDVADLRVAVVKVQRKNLASTLELSSEF